MHNGHRFSRIPADLVSKRGLTFPMRRDDHRSCYRHILVPTGLSLADQSALRLAFELAALHQSALTLLHVLPRPKPAQAAHGLDAISLLHTALEGQPTQSTAARPRELAPSRLRKHVEEVVPSGLMDSVHWRGVCRIGDVAKTIVASSSEFAADLVILSAKPFRWWLPLMTFDAWNIARRIHANVIVIRAPAVSIAS